VQNWNAPEATIAAMAPKGVRTLYLETGNYRQKTDLVRPAALARFIDAAHAAGIRVVAWYLPSFASPARDLRRSLAAIRFRTAAGGRFDSFALDIEASVVTPASVRNTRLLRLSAQIRAAVGPRYSLGAIIPSAVGIRLHPTYWPGFPYRELARIYDVFVPMAYFTYHATEPAAVREYLSESITVIRARTGNPAVPIHLIGGLSEDTGRAQARAFVQAVGDCAPVGYSLYEFPSTSRAAWSLLRSPPPPAGGC
jgi:hypothetical protein